MTGKDDTEREAALRAARQAGYLELPFSAEAIKQGSTVDEASQHIGEDWEAERAAAGRHAVTIGQILDGYFVVISFHGSEYAYVLEEFRDAFRFYFDEEPQFDVDALGNGLHGPWASHDVAVEAARALVAIDAKPRDADLETAFLVQTS